MKIDLKSGAAIASAVAMLLGASVPAQAADKEKAASKTVKCMGGNDCKGKSSCSAADSSCKGQNTCKGKGWIETKSAKACKKAGGKVVASKE